tara:strand:+ start:686 stop:1660 length:975 start_codon:yes stop_codon:yes gene_type:complete
MRFLIDISDVIGMNKHNSFSIFRELKIKKAFPIAFSILATLFTNNSHAAKVARVFVDSEASSTYNEYKESENGETYETYVFIKGNFYGGDISDNSLRNVTFEELVGTIGNSMKQRNFYPSASADQGDLLVVVHYGLMSVPQDLGDLFQLDMDDPYGEQPFDEDDEEVDEEQIDEDPFINDTYFNDLKRLSELSHNNQAGMSNIKLGIGRALNRKNITAAEEFDLRAELEAERYFIILMAYDYKKLRSAKKQELLWTTRFSVPSLGTNFENAYPALARAASSYYGSSLDKYATTSTHFGTGSVDIRTLETVGIEETEAIEFPINK